MHVAIVAAGVPVPGRGGGGNRAAGLIHGCAAAGHRVTLVGVVGKHVGLSTLEEHLQFYRERDIEVVTVPYRQAPPPAPPTSRLEGLLQIFQLCPEQPWPNEVDTRPFVQEAVNEARPDCVVSMFIDPIIYTHGLSDFPTFGMVSEWPHINVAVQLRWSPQVPPGPTGRYAYYALSQTASIRDQKRQFAGFLRSLDLTACSAPHYQALARKMGVAAPRLFRTHVADTAGPGWRGLRQGNPAGGSLKILMIGHLHSTSNRSGLAVFFHDILPALERELGPDAFEVHIVGEDQGMPASFDGWRNHPRLRFRGKIVPPDQEFLTSDIVLVPVAAKTGPRTRILSAFTFGCCVVAHAANAIGLPELKHEENVLLGKTGAEIARQVARAGRDADLRARLGEQGRKMFEANYTQDIAVRSFLALIDESVSRYRDRVGGQAGADAGMGTP